MSIWKSQQGGSDSSELTERVAALEAKFFDLTAEYLFENSSPFVISNVSTNSYRNAPLYPVVDVTLT